MGFLSGLKLARSVANSGALEFPTGPASQIAPLSPWTEGQLQGIVWSTLTEGKTLAVTRADAMSLPSVSVARSLILNSLAGRRLVALRGGEALKTQPAWLYRTNTAVPPWHRMAWTFDDLIFYGHSLWAVERGDQEQITDAVRVPMDQWRITPEGEIHVNDKPVPAKSVIYIPGPFEGLLNAAARTIRAALDLEASWTERAKTPMPMIVLKEREDNGMTQDEAKEHVDAVAEARRSPNGSVMFVPFALDAIMQGELAADLMIEARNAVKLDIANFLNLNGSATDAALPKASLNYETQQGTEQTFEGRMPYWTQPFEARLSMDDVCPRGQRIALDFGTNPTAPSNATGPYQED